MNNKTPFIAIVVALALFTAGGALADHFDIIASYNGPWSWNVLTMTEWSEGSGMDVSTFYKGTAEITGYSGSATDIAIPNKIVWHHDLTGPDLSNHFEYEVEIVGIGESAFRNCTGLTSVTIPDSVMSIANGAFYYCTSLTSVTIPASVTSIEEYAFAFCYDLKNVFLSDIAAWCAISNLYHLSPFVYASNLYLNGRLVTALTIPDGVASIPPYAFYNCDCLQSVHIPASVTNICDFAFGNCDNLVEISVPQCAMTKGLDIVFPNSYQKLRRLTLGHDVTSIRDDEFKNFWALNEFAVEAGSTNFSVAADGCLYDIGMTTLVACPRNATGITIPATVTKIHDNALDGCGALWANWYKALSNLAANGGGFSGASGSSEIPDLRYTLANGVADRSIATVTVEGDCAIDAFVLADGKVFDTVLRVINVSDTAATLSLPAGYAYERLKGTSPLTIPATSTNLLTITRTADRAFFVAREQLEPAQ